MRLVRFTGVAVKVTVKHILRALVYGTIGAALMLVLFGAQHLNNRPDLKVWHTAKLNEEFSRDSGIVSFEDYLAMEDRLFDELDSEVYAQTDNTAGNQINRYARGSLADPGTWQRNWNRSFEFKADDPVAGVLLLHGLSDSPYSLREIGKGLNQAGAWVLGLRIPGHGTAPSGLVDLEWEDMAAVVKLGMEHLRKQIENKSIHILGYSNGGALAVNYALDTLVDDTLPKASGLVLLSPEIGLTKLARYAKWQDRLGHVLGMEKLAWNTILPEYDPYKYNSFALNAGIQAYQLTNTIQSSFDRLGSDDALSRMPPVIAFQSVVDATVSAPAVVAGLFDRLPLGDHELVLYDFNRYAGMESVLSSTPSSWLNTMIEDRKLDFTITLLTNKDRSSIQMDVLSRPPQSEAIAQCPLNLEWPGSVYSLSHVALPFSPDDPLYGDIDPKDTSKLRLGNLALRGERGMLKISDSALMRLRWNPFYAYQEDRILSFLGLRSPKWDLCQ